MSLPAPMPRMTPEEYLAWEAQQEEKHEYLHGELRAMSGASWAHNVLASNLLVSVARGAPTRCTALGSDMRVKADSEAYVYPDLTLVCGKPDIQGTPPGSLANPLLVAEVLSPSTELLDRGDKLLMYRKITTLRGIILVSQERPLVEVYVRQGGEIWLFESREGLGGEISVDLPGWTLTLSLASLYRGALGPAGGPAQ